MLKLGFEVSEATVSRYTPHRPKSPSQTWRSFLRDHAQEIASIDFFVVPTATFRVPYVFLALEHERRRIVHFNVTAGPSARWTGQQLVNAFPYESAPKYLIRDRDKTYGAAFGRRVRAMGIAQVLTAPRSPWQSGRDGYDLAPDDVLRNDNRAIRSAEWVWRRIVGHHSARLCLFSQRWRQESRGAKHCEDLDRLVEDPVHDPVRSFDDFAH